MPPSAEASDRPVTPLSGRRYTPPTRRDAAIIVVFTPAGIRLSALAGIRQHPGDPARGDLNLHAREIRIRGKGGTAPDGQDRPPGGRSLDRYIRARHGQAWRPQLWPGVNDRGPLTATGIYQVVARRGRQAGSTPTRTGSGTTSATPGWTAAEPNGT
jgi:hypothetical protein